ncbi:superoxide dismutase [Propionibacterium australiense]|uniref:Superoxide dismutase n=1 Tax=Propionibacterium australiense TaxID=119981 RepID=A0A8B3FQX4_9ACTN|nr:superoxide dismutase [Propionibacterium australiense]RLP08137.1 superoxide dismutase [Propionibacterium australiense]
MLVTAASGCGAFHAEDYPTDGPSRTATSNPQEVTAEQFGHSWPFAVEHGTVGCEVNDDGDPVLTFTAPDGTRYALNSVQGNRELPDASEIASGSIGPIRSFAFSVCDV